MPKIRPFVHIKGADVASADPLPLIESGDYVDVTGTTGFTAMNTVRVGYHIILQFDGILTITHDGDDITLPGSANLTTAAGDVAMFVETAAGKWLCVDYTRASGVPIAGGVTSISVTSLADPSTELNAIAGLVKGEFQLCYQTVAGKDEWTLYAWDDADSGAEEVPYTVDGSSGIWTAIAGRYHQGALTTNGALSLGGALTLGGQIDVNGNAIGDGTRELVTFVEDGSAVNQVQIENEATGGGPIIRGDGDDVNVDLNLTTKASGKVNVLDGSDATKKLSVDLSGSTTGTTTTLLPTQTTDRSISLPDVAGTLMANVVEDTTPQLGGDLDLNGQAIDFPSTANISDVLDEDTLATDSATALATQQSIKAYVDALSVGVTALSVTSLADPSAELNAIAGAAKGEVRLCYQTVAGKDEFTLYAWDDADSGAESVPHTVDGSSGIWTAIGGRYVNGASSVLGQLTASGFTGPLTGNADTVTTNANLTGHVTSVGNAAVLGSFTSAQLATALTNETGTGSAVFATSPTLVTPALGTPASGVATNLSGTAASLTAGNVTTNANLTGHVTSVGNAAVLGSFTSAQLATALTNETGTGAAVFATSPTLVTPALGTPASGVATNLSGTAASLTAGAVSTITGLAPDTATTQATQAAITSAANLATVGALNAGSITSGFGAINNGASAITTTGIITGGTITPTGSIGRQKGGDIASASPLVIDTDGDYFDVTGTTGFAAMTVAANRLFHLQFDGVLTMTHGAALDLPGGANVTTAAGDEFTFFSDGTNTVRCISYSLASGAAISGTAGTGVYRHIYVPASAMIPLLTNGAVAGQTQSTTNLIMYDTMDFNDTVEQAVGFWVTLPDEWDLSTIKVKFHWTSVGGTGTVKWDIAALALTDSDVIDTALGTEATVTDTLLTADDMHITAASGALTVGGTPALGDPTYFEVTRDVGTDTLDNDALLLGVQIQYKESTTSPVAW